MKIHRGPKLVLCCFDNMALVDTGFHSRVASEHINLIDRDAHHPRGLRPENAGGSSRISYSSPFLSTHPPTSIFTACRVWSSKRLGWNGKPPQSRSFASLIGR